MLRKENRLSTPFEFKVTKKYGKKVEGATFFAYIIKAENYLGPSRFGIVVSTGYSKKAVERNRIKRLFSEAIMKRAGIALPNYWITIYPKYSSAQKTYEEIFADINKNLQEVFESR